jgi:hypothetical protein
MLGNKEGVHNITIIEDLIQEIEEDLVEVEGKEILAEEVEDQ